MKKRISVVGIVMATTMLGCCGCSLTSPDAERRESEVVSSEVVSEPSAYEDFLKSVSNYVGCNMEDVTFNKFNSVPVSVSADGKKSIKNEEVVYYVMQISNSDDVSFDLAKVHPDVITFVKVNENAVQLTEEETVETLGFSNAEIFSILEDEFGK